MTLTRLGATDVQQRTVSLTIDGQSLTVAEGTTIWQAARDVGIDIPTLCHDERYDPVGVCRMCVVDTGGRVDAAACIRPCGEGMNVATATPEIQNRRRVLTELLVADQPPRGRPEADHDRRQRADRGRGRLRHHRRGRPASGARPRPTCPIR